MAFGAVIFDFNGTLSDDEPILYRVYAEMFAEHGRPLSERDYYDELAGRSEEEILCRWLGRADP
jgi:beta-phosphoglucomutase